MMGPKRLRIRREKKESDKLSNKAQPKLDQPFPETAPIV